MWHTEYPKMLSFFFPSSVGLIRILLSLKTLPILYYHVQNKLAMYTLLVMYSLPVALSLKMSKGSAKLRHRNKKKPW